VAIKFNHKNDILSLKDKYPKLFEAYTSTKIEWEKDFAENNLKCTLITGSGKDEKLVLATKILIESKSIPVRFIEDAAGALTIEVNGKIVYTIKPMGRISQSFLDAFTDSIIKEHL
jgi:hypothetical protein